MLLQLQIENIAIIDRLNISLEQGFNVLTGETGAGKSILIDSINALLGSRVSRELIRAGAEKASVQGLFNKPEGLDALLEAYDIPNDDDTLLISRSFTEAGKNTCRVNGSLVTVAMLKDIGQRLIDIHGQHDNQSLLRPETHIALLDLFAGEALISVKNEYRCLLEELKIQQNKLKALSGAGGDRERTMDILRFQIDEIGKASLYEGEDEDLERQSRILANSEDIVSAFSQAYQAVRGGENDEIAACDGIQLALEALHRVEDIDPAYAAIAAALEEVEDKLSDISRDIRHIRDHVEYDPRLHKSIEERISLIQGLKKKYGASISDILHFKEEAVKRLDELERSEELILALKESIKITEAKLTALCEKMHGHRLEAAEVLAKGIMKELSELEMPKTAFSAAVMSAPEAGFTPDGTDQVEFMISPNPGEPLKPLSKIASGGEMSRVMLAVKAMLAGIDSIPTLIFDEIDSGVSGKAASRVGEKLSAVAAGHQVLCITHHAQIASLADAHFYISKAEQNGRTVTQVTVLEGKQREDEITRLLSGEHVTDAARSLARELLKKDR